MKEYKNKKELLIDLGFKRLDNGINLFYKDVELWYSPSLGLRKDTPRFLDMWSHVYTTGFLKYIYLYWHLYDSKFCIYTPPGYKYSKYFLSDDEIFDIVFTEEEKKTILFNLDIYLERK